MDLHTWGSSTLLVAPHPRADQDIVNGKTMYTCRITIVLHSPHRLHNNPDADRFHRRHHLRHHHPENEIRYLEFEDDLLYLTMIILNITHSDSATKLNLFPAMLAT